MRSLLSTMVVTGALACGACVVGCTANVHDNTVSIPNATVNMTSSADTTSVMPSEQVPIQVNVQNVTLVDPSQMPPPSQNMDDTGYLEIHLDTEDTAALLVTAQVSFNVTIPADTKAGDHKLICRLHKHDGTPTDVESELKITVKATVSVGPVDAGAG